MNGNCKVKKPVLIGLAAAGICAVIAGVLFGLYTKNLWDMAVELPMESGMWTTWNTSMNTCDFRCHTEDGGVLQITFQNDKEHDCQVFLQKRGLFEHTEDVARLDVAAGEEGTFRYDQLTTGRYRLHVQSVDGGAVGGMMNVVQVKE